MIAKQNKLKNYETYGFKVASCDLVKLRDAIAHQQGGIVFNMRSQILVQSEYCAAIHNIE